MAASALFILDLKGKPLISRNYKGDVGLGEIEHFMGLLLQREEEGTLAPLLTHGHVHFLWIKHANNQWWHTTKKNGNASLVYSFLYKVVEVFCEYFKELEEESIRDNFVIVYELLDELMDFGFPQTTDSKILQEYITQEGNKLETSKSRVPTTVTNAVSWRSEGIKYKKNEVFIDVIESVNLLGLQLGPRWGGGRVMVVGAVMGPVDGHGDAGGTGDGGGTSGGAGDEDGDGDDDGAS
ncbi:AP-1 complex subunit mu-2 [Rissa tridactyla]|uniref:AP-1 complex subunit mu-2 n=1 Tax=Rissa tridactyla TaxID=75485 RepID=UPI0023BAE305|nr:AP-1 complex subunit mu-2 [Rissa tridactyla]